MGGGGWWATWAQEKVENRWEAAYVSSLPIRRRFSALPSPPVMSSQPLRQWLAPAARCLNRAQARQATRNARRLIATWEHGVRPLETQEDWTDLQLDRAHFKTLGSSTHNVSMHSMFNVLFITT